MNSTQSETQSDTGSQWYVRRGDVVRGPFAQEKISEYLVRGSLRTGDELSQDRENWRLASECRELFPPLLSDDEDDAQQRQWLMAKQQWVIERDRFAEASPYQQTERNSPVEPLNPYEMSAADADSSHTVTRAGGSKSQGPSRVVVGSVIFLLLSAIGAYIYLNQPEPETGGIDCNAAAAPRINWSNCQMEAVSLRSVDLRGALMQNMNLMRADLRRSSLVTANLSFSNLSAALLTGADFREAKLVGVSLKGADLRNAKFNGADLSYADFQGANIRSASFANVKLDKTIWVDGRVCAVGSVGRCQ